MLKPLVNNSEPKNGIEEEKIALEEVVHLDCNRGFAQVLIVDDNPFNIYALDGLL